MSFDSITNRGEFFSNHYLEAVLASDLGDLQLNLGRRRSPRRAQPPAADSRAALQRSSPLAPTPTRPVRATPTTRCVGSTTSCSACSGSSPTEPTWSSSRTPSISSTCRSPPRSRPRPGLLLVAHRSRQRTSGRRPVRLRRTPAPHRRRPTRRTPPHGLPQRRQASRLRGSRCGRRDLQHRRTAADVLVLGGSVVLLAERAKWSEALPRRRSRPGVRPQRHVRQGRAGDHRGTLLRRRARAGRWTVGARDPGRQVTQARRRCLQGAATGIRESIEIIANEVIAQRDADCANATGRSSPDRRRCPRSHPSVTPIPASAHRAAVRGIASRNWHRARGRPGLRRRLQPRPPP